MLNPLAEAACFCRQWRGIAWRGNLQSHVILPATAVVAAWGAGAAVAALFWLAQGIHPAVFLGLLLLIVPAACGVFLTYHFDLLEIGLGWRVVDLSIQLGLAALLSIALAESTSLIGAAAAVLAAWAVGISIGSDLVAFRCDKVAGYPKAIARLATAKHELDRNLFIIILALGMIFALAAQLLPSFSLACNIVAGVGAAALLGAVMDIQASLGLVIRRACLDPESAAMLGDSAPLTRLWVRRALAAALSVSLLLPSGISPFAHSSFNAIGDSVTTRLGSLFVPSPKINSIFRFRWPWANSESLATSSLLYWISLLLAVPLIVIILVAVRTFWRMLRSESRRTHVAGDYDPFWRSLWRAILRWFSRRQEAIGKWFIPNDAKRARARVLFTGQHKRAERPGEPGALIRWLFARLARQAGTCGQARAKNETAAEYGLRLEQHMAAESGTALSRFVRLYEGARYGRSPIGAATAAIAVSLWRGACRGLRRFSGRTAAR